MGKSKFGVIGVGTWGENHVRAYRQNPRSELAAVSDVNEERGRAVSERYGVRYYKDYADMLEDETIDAVSVATPDFLHRQPCVDAAEAGKHVLVEKPLATTVEDAEAIVEAARKSGVKLMVDFHNRWNPPFAQAKASISEGEIGEPIYIFARISNTKLSPTAFLKWASRSKVIWFLAAHTCDLARWLFEDEAETAYAAAASKVLAPVGVDTPDLYASIVRFRKGGIANLESAWVLPNTMPGVGWGEWAGLGITFEMQIIGTRGAYVLKPFPNQAAQKYTDRSYSWPDTQSAYFVQGRWGGFAIEAINHFVDCVVDDKTPAVGGEDGLAVTKIVCAIDRSARTGAPERV
ncbi:MAG: Gfo/Idh/MocA family oxidoreductase [Candidatus Brockarchaeota archaeon]|nr:Gfo/Idh/MocA family oxidoreductase [Candidatus Brockarchaeota archaeon]